VKALNKEKKKKENVLTNLELVNLKNASLLKFEELRKTMANAKKKVDGGKEWVSKESIALVSIVGDCTRIEKESRPNWCQEKAKRL
jgi:hypothetical protein